MTKTDATIIICHNASRLPIAALALTVLLGGCGVYSGSVGNNANLMRGIEPRVEDLSFAEAAAAQTNLIEALKQQAQLSDIKLKPQDGNWALVLKAGLQLVDGRCDQYLDVLFRFNREQRAARKGLTAATAATAGIMGLTGAAGKAVAVVATALGLATALFDANVDSVLFQIEPSALRNVVLQGRQKYISDLLDRTKQLTTIDTRPDMMIALQGYLTQCSPAAIEANINNAANGSPFAVTLPPLAGKETPAASAVSTGTPSVSLLGRKEGLSQNSPAPAPPRPQRRFDPSLKIPGSSSFDSGAMNRVLAALGVAAGLDSAAVSGHAMIAIGQAQLGAGRHDARYLSDPRGTLEGDLTKSLLSVGRMPAQFHTPFERFLLGDPTTNYATLDLTRMNGLRDRLGLPASDLSPGADLWAGVRAKLRTLHEQKGLPPPVSLAAGVTDYAALDAALYDQIDRRQKPVGPAAASPIPVTPSASGAVQ